MYYWVVISSSKKVYEQKRVVTFINGSFPQIHTRNMIYKDQALKFESVEKANIAVRNFKLYIYQCQLFKFSKSMVNENFSSMMFFKWITDHKSSDPLINVARLLNVTNRN